MLRTRVTVLLLTAAAAAAPARSLAAGPAGASGQVVGLELDLLPVAISAADREIGGGLGIWAGRGRDRLRLVTALVRFPESLTEAPFRDRELTAMALLYDRFFREGFRGPWIGGGAELWWTDVGTTLGPQRGERVSPVVTAGAGWVFRVWRGLYVNPWAAGHVVLGDRGIEVRGERYRLRALEGEVSLKVGWAHRL